MVVIIMVSRDSLQVYLFFLGLSLGVRLYLLARKALRSKLRHSVLLTSRKLYSVLTWQFLEPRKATQQGALSSRLL